MPRRREKLAKTVRLGAIGGAVAAAAAAIALKRDKLARLLPFGGEEPAPSPGPEAAPGPSNYDASGPVANTATPVPAPEPVAPPAIDEEAEEAAAAAEAANIGGTVSDYAAAEEQRPLMEGGQGEAEGQEQTEAELTEAAEPTAPGVSDETEDANAPEGGGEGEEAPKAPDDDDGAEWRTWSGPSVKP